MGTEDKNMIESDKILKNIHLWKEKEEIDKFVIIKSESEHQDE